MARRASWPRRLGKLFLAGALLGGAGCLSFVNPCKPATKEQAAPCLAVPQPWRNHVYIFLVHGMDPLDAANLAGLNEYIRSLGFLKTYYGQMYHYWYFKHEMRRLHKEDPQNRFVVIGFSFGANLARELVNAVKDDGVPIDLLVYFGGNTLENTPPNRPDHVGRIVNILATGCIWNGATLDGAVNTHYDNVWHFGSPTHPDSRKMLIEELAAVACNVQLTEPVLEPLEEGPRPRPVMPRAVGPRDEWDFLKPEQNFDGSRKGARPRELETAPPPRHMFNPGRSPGNAKPGGEVRQPGLWMWLFGGDAKEETPKN